MHFFLELIEWLGFSGSTESFFATTSDGANIGTTPIQGRS